MITNLFPTPIYEARYDENLEPYIQKCLELKDTVECGGEDWIGKPYNTLGTYNLFEDKDFRPLCKWINTHTLKFAGELNLKPFVRRGAWFNIYNKGDYQEFHDHNFDSVSGIFYLQAKEDDAKSIFVSPLRDLPYEGEFDPKNKYTWKQYHISPKQGKLILFKSDLLHGVEGQKENTNRITISFNYSHF